MSNHCESRFQVFFGPKPAGLKFSLSPRSEESDQRSECKPSTQLQEAHPVQKETQQIKTYSAVALKLGPASKMPSPPQSDTLQVLPLLSYDTHSP